MKLEVGKFYKTKNGTKVGPCRIHVVFSYLYECEDNITNNTWTYTDDGKGVGLDDASGFNIIDEWIDAEPVEKRVKQIHEMSLIDYQRGIDAVWDSMRPHGV